MQYIYIYIYIYINITLNIGTSITNRDSVTDLLLRKLEYQESEFRKMCRYCSLNTRKISEKQVAGV